MRLGKNKLAIVFKLIIILLVSTVVYHALDVSFECLPTNSWNHFISWAGLLDQVIDTVLLVGLAAAVETIIQSLREMLSRAFIWIGYFHTFKKRISPIALSTGGHAPPVFL